MTKKPRSFLPVDIQADLLPVMNIMFLLIPALLVAMEFASMAQISISPPKMCGGCGNPTTETSKPLALRVEIRRDGFALNTGGASLPEIGLRDGSLDHQALGLAAKELKVAHPDEIQVTVTAENDIPMAALVETLDTLRGADCKLAGVARGEAPGAACLFYQPVIES
jgi:biopolymer transport protein ExbD